MQMKCNFVYNLVILAKLFCMSKVLFFNTVFSFYGLLLTTLFVGCTPSTFNEDKGEEMDANAIAYLSINEINRKAKAFDYGAKVVSNPAVCSFQSEFTLTKGNDFFDANQLEIKLLKLTDRIELEIVLNVYKFGPYPTVYNASFNENEIADQLKTVLTVRNSQNKKTVQVSDSESISQDGSVRYSWSFNPSDLKSIKEGLVDFDISIDSYFCSFFGVESKTHPIQAGIQFKYYVPSIFESVIYFNGLALNEKRATQILGNNDWNNSTPETGIIISCNNQRIIYSYTKNSFSNNKEETAKFYHTNVLDSILIAVVDVDYGFNGNDLISDTLLPIQSLEGKTYFDLPLKAVDKLLLYTQFKGRVN